MRTTTCSRTKSQYYGATSRQQAPVVEVAGDWRDVLLWDNTVEGGGAHDRLNLLLEIDAAPAHALDGRDRLHGLPLLSSGANFAQPDGASFSTLAAWKADNSGRWDRHSAVGRGPTAPASRLREPSSSWARPEESRLLTPVLPSEETQ